MSKISEAEKNEAKAGLEVLRFARENTQYEIRGSDYWTCFHTTFWTLAHRMAKYLVTQKLNAGEEITYPDKLFQTLMTIEKEVLTFRPDGCKSSLDRDDMKFILNFISKEYGLA